MAPWDLASNNLEMQNKQHMGVSKNRVPQNGWFIMENPIKMDDLGLPLFLETPISQVIQVVTFLFPSWR